MCALCCEACTNLGAVAKLSHLLLSHPSHRLKRDLVLLTLIAMKNILVKKNRSEVGQELRPLSRREVLAISHALAGVMALHMESAEVASLGAAAIASLAKGDKERREDVAQSTLRVLTQALTQHAMVDKVQYHCNLAIVHLCLLTPSSKKSCIEYDAPSVIISGMAHNLIAARVQIWGMRALCTLCHGEPTYCEALREQDMLATTVLQATSMHSGNAELQVWARKALALTGNLSC